MMGVSCWDFGIKNNMHNLYIYTPQKSKKAHPCLLTTPISYAEGFTERYKQKTPSLIKTTKNIYLYLLLFLYV